MWYQKREGGPSLVILNKGRGGIPCDIKEDGGAGGQAGGRRAPGVIALRRARPPPRRLHQPDGPRRVQGLEQRAAWARSGVLQTVSF